MDLTGVTLIALGEFAIQKGHCCATSIVDPRTTKVLWVAVAAIDGRYLKKAATPRDN